MNIIQRILTKNDCYKAGRTITPKGVMVHSTGANNPNLARYIPPDDLIGYNKYNNHWDMAGTNACVHGFIGKLADGSVATVQTLPWHWRGWHCASGKYGSGNNTHISFEICEDGLTDSAYFVKVYNAAVELTAYLCGLYSLNPLADGVVICHSEGYQRGIASNHGDVMHWFPRHGKSMDTFRADVAAMMAKTVDVSYNVTVTATDGLNCRQSPTTASSIVKTYAYNTTLTITKESNGWGYTGDGWVSLSYTTKINEEEFEMRYNKISDIPAWGQTTIKKMCDNGYLGGNGGAKDSNGYPTDLDLSLDMIRCFVANDRAGLYD